MYCPEAYLSLAEIADAFAAVAERRVITDIPNKGLEPKFHIDTGPSAAECEAYVHWLMWRFIEQFATKIRVATPTGAVLRISPSIFYSELDDPFDASDYSGFPETRVALLRASELRPPCIAFDGMLITDRLPDSLSEGERLVLHTLENFPLCIEEALIPTSVEDLISKIIENSKNRGAELELFKQGDNYRHLVQRLIKAWDNKEFTTKRGAYELLGRRFKTEERRAIWSAFANSRPLASKPGPRAKH